MTVPLLQVRGLRARYGKVPVLHDVDLDLADKSSLGIVGASGSGKTTLARVIAGLLPADAGQIIWRGQDITRLSRAARRDAAVAIAMVFQDPQSSLNPRMPIWQSVTEATILRGTRQGRAALRDHAASLLDLVSLPTAFVDRLPHALSGGQRQRVAIARALCAEPQLLILDEPTSALDLTVQAQVLELLAQLRADLGIASLFVTHDLHVVRRACDQILVLDAGRVAETGEMAAVLDAPTHDYSRRLVAATPSIGKAMDLDQFA